jgi:hypothetical protein
LDEGKAMIYRGRVKNGMVVLDEDATLPDGIEVRVEPVESSPQKTLAEKFQNVIGKAKDLPSDMAEQHDHYIHGTPKK